MIRQWDGKWSARQTPMRMANGLDAAIGISAELLCCEHCCQDKAGNESSQVISCLVIPVIDVTPPAVPKLSARRR
ncbi:hypothetical protein KCP78_21680 [Salmonella enterica subsp. enterica]|nr:hypothetical protein KCP78_21680 [Salmonella enterica subsp. enterica]